MQVVVAHRIRSRLQEILDADGLNYQTAAAATGVDIGTIRRYAKNQFDRIDCNSADAICTYFKKPLGDVFFVVPNNDPGKEN